MDSDLALGNMNLDFFKREKIITRSLLHNSVLNNKSPWKLTN